MARTQTDDGRRIFNSRRANFSLKIIISFHVSCKYKKEIIDDDKSNGGG